MKKIKLIVILLITLLIITAIIIGSILIIQKDNNINQNSGEIGDVLEDEDTTKIKNVSESDKFFTTLACINNYFSQLNNNSSNYYGRDENNNFTKIVSDDEINENRLNLLSSKYIQENNITKNNFSKKIQTYSEDVSVVALEMKVVESETMESYAVHGVLLTTDNKYIKDIYMIVDIDLGNKTFAITPVDNCSSIDDIDLKYNDTRIENNGSNQYTRAIVSNEELAKRYLVIYKRLAIAKPDILYNYIDKEYRDIKFGTYDKFLEYIQKNMNQIKNIYTKKYIINDDVEDYIREIIIKDQYDNVYIIDEKNIMDISIRYDEYTVLKDIKLKQYNSGDEKEKVGMNIERVFQAINYKDYEYVYNRLNTTFRNNKFPNIEILKQFINTRFFDKNEIGESTISKEGDVYQVGITIKDANNANNKSNLTIMVRLLEETGFEISFAM